MEAGREEGKKEGRKEGRREEQTSWSHIILRTKSLSRVERNFEVDELISISYICRLSWFQIPGRTAGK
jgi:hypothetical protein